MAKFGALVRDYLRTFGLPIGFVLGLLFAMAMASSKPEPEATEAPAYMPYAVVQTHFRYQGEWQRPETRWLAVDTGEARVIKIIPEAFREYWEKRASGETVPLPTTWSQWEEPKEQQNEGHTQMYLHEERFERAEWEGRLYHKGTRFYSPR